MANLRSIGWGIAMLTLLVAPSLAEAHQRLTIQPPPGSSAPVQVETRVHSVNVAVQGQIATTTIEHVFFNPTRHRLEGQFMLPIPSDTAVDRFTMKINGTDTEAELLDAQEARKIYESIVRQMRDPALLELAGHQLLRARIFPMDPRSETSITLTYTHLLPSDDGVIRYIYPLQGRTVHGRTNLPITFELDLRSEQPISTVYSPSHDVQVVRHNPRHVTVAMEADNAGDTDLAVLFAPQRGEAELAFQVLTYRDGSSDPTGSDDGFFLLLLNPGDLARQHQPMPKDVIFVLDTSGSMSGGKLDQAKRALIFCLDNLNDDDRFEIVRFASDVEPVFGSLRPATRDNRREAQDFVERLRPTGATAIHAAVKQALDTFAPDRDDSRPRMVIFLTDGRANVGPRSNDEIVHMAQERSSGARIFCFGIGSDVNTHLLDRMAEATHAVSEYVLPQEDIELKVSRFYSRIAQPVLANLAIEPSDAGSVRLSGIYPQALPDLFAGDQLVVLGRYRGSGEVTLAITGSTRDEARRFARQVQFHAAAKEHAFVPRLWAMRRVGALLDQARLHGDNSELRDEIAALSRAFNIITPQTAYLILEEENRRAVPALRQTAARALGVEEDAVEPLRQELRRQYEQLTEAQVGDEAVAAAQANRMLREANNADGYIQTRHRFADAAGTPAQSMPRSGAADHRQRGGDAIASNARYVRGRTFVREGAQWIDTRVQQLPADAQPRRIVFGSDAYFALLNDHPEAAAWLSIGRNMQLALDGDFVEIHDPAGE